MAGDELCFICCTVALSTVRHHISEYQIRTALQTTGCWRGTAAYHSLPLQCVEGLASPPLPRKGSGLVQHQAVAGVLAAVNSPSHILSSCSLGRRSRTRFPRTSHSHLPSQPSSSLSPCLPILLLQQQQNGPPPTDL